MPYSTKILKFGRKKKRVWFGVRLLAFHFTDPSLHLTLPHHTTPTPLLSFSFPFFYFSSFCHFSSHQNLHFSIALGSCFAITGFRTFFKLLQLVHFSTLSILVSQVVLCFMLSSYVCYPHMFLSASYSETNPDFDPKLYDSHSCLQSLNTIPNVISYAVWVFNLMLIKLLSL